MLNSIFAQAAIFTAVVAVILLVSIWWLYLSPARNNENPVERPSARLAAILASLLGLAALLLVTGALWDASMHIETGEIPAGADFLWPPHLLLYGGFLLALLVAMVAVGKIAASGWRNGVRDPRQWVRQNPYLGAVALASFYELLAIPSDALWHAIFGEDLTAWSPPHILLGVMGSIVTVSAVGLLAQTRFATSWKTWRQVGVIALLGLTLNIAYIIGVLEWELPVRPALVSARPLWVYPLVAGAVAFFALALSRRLLDFPWAASATALAFLLVRLPIATILGLTDNVSPAVPLMFLLGAFLMDVLPLKRIKPPILRGLAMAAAFTLGYSLLALPQLAIYTNLPRLNSLDILFTILSTLLASLALLPLANLAGGQLLGKQRIKV
jgi:hypothetical protein